jgi:protein-tyrosine-phosphatase
MKLYYAAKTALVFINPNIVIPLVLVAGFVYLILINTTKKVQPSEQYLDSISIGRNTEIESMYKQNFISKDIPYYVVEKVWSIFEDVCISPPNPITSSYLSSSAKFTWSNGQYTGDFNWDFNWDSWSPNHVAIRLLEEVENQFSTSLSSTEVANIHSFYDLVHLLKSRLPERPSILVASQGNASLSLLAFALFDYLGKGRFETFAACRIQVEKMNPNVILTLENNDISTEITPCQTIDYYADKQFDIIIFINDFSLDEKVKVLLKGKVIVDWAIPDPEYVFGSEGDPKTGFQTCFNILKERISQVVLTPIEAMQPDEISYVFDRVERIS